MTKIEWTATYHADGSVSQGKTWNFITGCNKVSPGCKNCYAEVMAKRLQAMGQSRYTNGFALTLHEDVLSLPLRWKTPQRIFVNSMSDLYHEQVPLEFLLRGFAVMQQAHWHQYQILTKRSKRLLELDPFLPWMPHIWQGVSVERADYQWRIADLRKTRAAVKFLSLEPLLGPLPHLNLRGIDWVIIGGESGHKARPLEVAWIREIIAQCRAQGVAIFVKQLGSVWAKTHGMHDKGGSWEAWEPDLRIREYPVLSPDKEEVAHARLHLL